MKMYNIEEISCNWIFVKENLIFDHTRYVYFSILSSITSRKLYIPLNIFHSDSWIYCVVDKKMFSLTVFQQIHNRFHINILVYKNI